MEKSIFLAAFCLIIFRVGYINGEEVKIYLDPEDKYEVTWSFDGTGPSNEITFTVKCETTGWVGLGLSPNGGMAGADIVVMWIDGDGKAHIKDMHAISNGFPSEDASQDYTLLSSSEKNDVSTFTFKRKINTCDSDDYKIMSSTVRLIYAYGDSDPANNKFSPNDKHLHNKKGARSVYLLDVQQTAQVVPDDALTLDLTVNKYLIPETETTYYCSFHEIPHLDSKHHIIAVEPIVQKGNEGFVHHILIYGCWGVSEAHLRNNNKTEGVCFTNEMPEFEDSCRAVVFGWAVGGTKYYMPEEAGYPIGTNDTLSPQYFLMELHYDNPQGFKGQVDSSGIRLTYTPTLRKYDVGNLQIGSVYGIFVPPKAKEFDVIGYCHSGCTKQWVPEEGLNLFGYFLHSHLLGIKIKLEHYRNDEAVEIMTHDDNYDFNFQENRRFKEYKKLLPGDTLKITCTYKSTERTMVTYGGLSSSEEMCLTFITYYPKQSTADCMSVPGFMFNQLDGLYSGLSLIPNVTKNAEGFPIVHAVDTLNSVLDWTDDKISSAQVGYKETYPYSVCSKNGGERHEGATFNPFLYPTIEEVKQEDPCKEKEDNSPSSSMSVWSGCVSVIIPLVMYLTY